MTWRVRDAVWAIAAVSMVTFAAACGDNNNNNNGGGGGGGGGATGTSTTNQTGSLKVEIQSAEVPDTGSPAITFRVTDGDQPVTNLVQEVKNGVVPAGQTPTTFPWTSIPRIVVAKQDAATAEFTSYYTTQATGAPFTPPGGTEQQPKLASATQATFDQAPTDAALDQRLTHQGNGVYRYTLAPLPAGAPVERSKPHTAGIWLTRHTAAGEAATSSATGTLDFIPAGGTAARPEIVSSQACNACHGPAVAAHDERLGVTVCQTCHSPQTTDPDSGNIVDFKVMVHKIHMGGDLPSAQGANGQPYTIVGFRSTVFEFDKAWMHDVRDCTVCHQGKDADRWKNNANQAACTSCHDNVRFDGSGAAACTAGVTDTAPCNHLQIGTSACTTCHTATAAGIGVQTVHVPLATIAQQFKYEIQDAHIAGDNPTTAGTTETRAPVVRFRVLDANGQPRALADDPAYKDPNSSLTAVFSWPSQEYTNEGSGQTSPGQPIRQSIVARPTGSPATAPAALSSAVVPVTGQAGVYDVYGPDLPDPATFTTTRASLGAGAVTSLSVHLEGHPVVNGQQIPVENVILSFPFTAGGQVQARRQVVDVAKCDACHGQLSAHGENRNNNPQVCVACHNPRATDLGRRAAASGPCATGTPEQSIDFKRMIHEIHGGSIRRNDLTICGFGNTAVTFDAGSEVPSNVIQNCAICHVNETYQVPPSGSIIPLDTTLTSGASVASQGDDATTPAVIAVCTACHDNVKFTQTAGLPICGTLTDVNGEPCAHTGGEATLGTTCVACHGKGTALDVAKVHAVQP